MNKVQAIIYDLNGGTPYFLLFHRILHWRGWELLKETMEPGETQMQSLRRGIREETNLRRFLIEKRLNKRFTWKWNGKQVFIAQVYLVRAPMQQKIDIRQDVMEHDAYRWVTKKEALKMLTHANQRQLLRELQL